MIDDWMARLCLSAVIEPGHPAMSAAVREFGAAEVWHGLLESSAETGAGCRARNLDPQELRARAIDSAQRFITPGDDEWPAGLGDLATAEQVRELAGEPLGLWVAGAGDLGVLVKQSVAIVGSRASTGYGDQVAADIAAEVSEAGCAVVSGGAYGIDAAAHRGALAGRTPTVAVLAGGLDQPYPAGHARLFGRIRETGVLVSELAPGEHPTRVRFLARNRLIAAMTPGTLIVEAAARSGARNTVTWAGVLGRPVMAVPGPVTSANSVTPHRLIREAEAVLVASATEVLDLLAPLDAQRPAVRPKAVVRPTDTLGADELAVFEAIPARRSTGAGDLAVRTGLSVPTCLAVLSRLEEAGFVAQGDAGQWRLSRHRAS